MAKKERLTYKEWKDEQKEPSFQVYIITGKHHWKKEFMASLKKTHNCDYTRIEKGVKDNLKNLNYRPMGKKKHLLMFESIDRITKEDMNEIVAYIKKPSKYAILVVSIDTWIDKKALLKNFKYLESSLVVKLFELDFPSRDFVMDYIRDVSNRFGIVYQSKSAMDYLFRRLYTSTQDIVDSIQTLSTLEREIDKEAITTYTEDYSTYNYDQLYGSLTRLDRKKVPYISYNDLIESGKKDTTIMINIRKHFNYLYQAKYLKLEGILRNNDIIEMKKPLYEKGDLQFKNNSIFDLSDYKINYYLEASDDIPLKDILRVLTIIDRNMPGVTEKALENNNKKADKMDGNKANIVEVKKPSKKMVYDENPEIQSFKTILDLLGRNL